ncbi:MAG: MBL fold metallo-hydrolase [Candidatus Omnitrophota bacterium]|nr:MBL fold metallo-hydrolase [Candidatus Omnitrophota bacterium]
MAVRIKFLGGVRNVTGSSHLVMTDKAQILLDCGLFQGHRDAAYQANTTFSYNPRKVNALVLSHAHIDHCGNIPSVIKRGLRCKIYTTLATKDLAVVMLKDSGKIQEEDIRYVNKINRRLGLPKRAPLYTEKEASSSMKRARPISYGKKFPLEKGIFVTLYDAGHILGSSIIVLDIKDNSRNIRLAYAVDLGRKGLPLLNDPVIPKDVDYLIIESTYGARLHAPIAEAKGKLRDTINRTVERKGKIIIPAFALERTQEALSILKELFGEKAIPTIPIYVDSPLATDITDVFKQHLSFLDEETRRAIREGNSPFESLHLRYIRNKEESKRLNDDRRPMIIIAGSGMCESGRISHHLKNNIEDSRNTVLVIGYMAENTLGKKIVDKIRVVRIFGVEYELNAEVVIINSFSGHADKEELLEFSLSCAPLKRVFLVHGEESQALSLKETLLAKGLDAYVPVKDEEVILE